MMRHAMPPEAPSGPFPRPAAGTGPWAAMAPGGHSGPFPRPAPAPGSRPRLIAADAYTEAFLDGLPIPADPDPGRPAEWNETPHAPQAPTPTTGPSPWDPAPGGDPGTPPAVHPGEAPTGPSPAMPFSIPAPSYAADPRRYPSPPPYPPHQPRD
ncbi:hypothetical protein DSY14_04450 [Nocardiopsis sp. MG754419]|nr:hypothetical protein [Nocardiopsis sp. MG754419]